MEVKYTKYGEGGILFKTEDINPHHTIIFGVTRSGKSTLLEKLLQKEYENNSKIVDVWDAKNDLEGAFRLFPPDKRQIDLMKEILRGIVPAYEGRTYPVKIYHPLCLNIPNRLPSCFRIFTIPFNSLTKQDLDFLAENTKPTESIEIILETIEDMIKKMGNSVTIPDFIDKIYGESLSYDYFGRKLKLTKNVIRHSRKIFGRFRKEFLITSSNNRLALTEEKLIKEMNDNKTFAIFSTKYIDNMKLKMFVTLWIINQIAKIKTEGRIIPKINIAMRDLFTFAPSKDLISEDEKYKETSTRRIFDILATFGSKNVEVDADCQDPTSLSDKLKGQFTEMLIGSINNPHAIENLMESGMALDRYALYKIYKLKELKIKMIYDVATTDFYIITFPSHKHREPQDDFFKLWEKHYNTYKDWTKEIAESKAELHSAIEKIRKEEKTIEEEIEEKEKILKREEGLPEELKKMKEFVRLDVERILKVKSRTANTNIKRWKSKGFIDVIGDPSSKNVKYKIVSS